MAELSPEELQQRSPVANDGRPAGRRGETLRCRHRAAGLRSKLLEIPIDSRYKVARCTHRGPSRNNDAVRSWFIDSWHSSGLVVRSIAQQHQGRGIPAVVQRRDRRRCTLHAPTSWAPLSLIIEPTAACGDWPG